MSKSTRKRLCQNIDVVQYVAAFSVVQWLLGLLKEMNKGDFHEIISIWNEYYMIIILWI